MTGTVGNKVPFLTKLTYSLPAFSLAVVGIPVYFCLPKFYTDVVGIDIVGLGYILMSVRIFDALTDPAIVYISDRTRTRFGRRRPYIALGTVFVALTMIFLFNPPEASPAFETVWFTVFICALFMFWTVVVVSYESLGPEITFDYNDRTSLFAMRDGFLIAGTLAAASSPALVQWLFGLSNDASGERGGFFWSGERREGQYIGLWSIAKKMAAAVGVGIGLSVLGLAGYTPNVEQSEQVRLTLRALYAVVPSVCIIAFAIALTYPISSRIHQDIRTAITLRRNGQSVRNPLEPSQVLALR